MNYLPAQVILAARNGDIEKWGNILFVAVVAIFWIVSGILKARSGQAQQKKREELGLKPSLRPPQPHRARTGPRPVQKTAFQQAQRPVTHPVPRQPQQAQPPLRKVARPQQAIQRPAAEKKQPKLGLLSRKIKPEFEELPEITGETVKKPIKKRTRIPAEAAMPKYLPDILSDYADTESLRRAILHYEILGKPLALRDPTEHIIGL